MRIYEYNFQGRRTHQELALKGTLFATFKFTIYKYKNDRYIFLKTENYQGNDTTSNVRANAGLMHRNAYKDAKNRLFHDYGGSPKFTVKEIDYYYIYRESLKVQEAEKHKKTSVSRDLNYYNNEIPDTDRTYKTPKNKKKSSIGNVGQKTKRNTVSKMKQEKSVSGNKKSVSERQKSRRKSDKNTEKALQIVR